MTSDYSLNELFKLLTHNSKVHHGDVMLVSPDLLANCNDTQNATSLPCDYDASESDGRAEALFEAEAAILHYIFPLLALTSSITNIVLVLPMFRLMRRSFQLYAYCMIISVSHVMTFVTWPAAIDAVLRLFAEAAGGRARVTNTPFMQSLRNRLAGWCQWTLFIEHFTRQFDRWLFVCLLADVCVLAARPKRLVTLRGSVADFIFILIQV